MALDHHRHARWPEAEAIYQQVLQRIPNCAEALHLLGMLRHETGRTREAVELLRRSVEIDPGQAHVLSNYGSLLAKSGQAAQAIAPLSEAIRLAPQFAEGHNNLGAALERLSRWPEALACFDRAVQLKPDYAEAHTHRGNVLRWLGRIDAAIEAYQVALRLRPEHALAHSGLASAHAEAGDAEACIRSQREVMRIWAPPHRSAATAHSDLLYVLHYDSGVSAEEMFAEHQRWSALHAEPLYPRGEPRFDNDPTPDRRLRVGYVSADFRSHPIATFLWAALTHRDRQQFEVFCYSDVRRPDRVTQRFRETSDHWRQTGSLTDGQLANLVREDRIDVLVDQNGHAAGNRMPLFARRAAPVQATFNGYVDTTGLRTMDYRLTDEYHDPPGLTERLYTERLLRLPGGHWCYSPDVDGTPLPPVAPPPSLANGFVTFGCLNKPVKMNDQVLGLWAQLLDRLPAARLLLAIAGGPSENRGFPDRCRRAGLPADRLIILPKTATRRTYLERYHQIDIALDTFPFNGMTTTCDALLMGVPVITVAGKAHVSRAGVSFLTMAGFSQYVGDTFDDYLHIAVSLARASGSLSAIRIGLRRKLLASELCDKSRFARKIENGYRTIWREWCQRNPEF